VWLSLVASGVYSVGMPLSAPTMKPMTCSLTHWLRRCFRASAIGGPTCWCPKLTWPQSSGRATAADVTGLRRVYAGRIPSQTYNDVAMGLAQWVADAIHANTDRAGLNRPDGPGREQFGLSVVLLSEAASRDPHLRHRYPGHGRRSGGPLDHHFFPRPRSPACRMSR